MIKEFYLEKNQDNFSSTRIPFRVDSVLIGQGLANEEMKMGDIVTIFSLDDIKGQKPQTVSISGPIKRPGDYSIADNMKISEILFLADGFEDSSAVSKIFMDRADLIRIDKNQKSRSIYSFNLNEILQNFNSDKNILLKGGDRIRIYPNEIFEFSKTVELKGSVKNPGQYELKNNMTLIDLLLEAGGFLNDAYRLRYEVSRIDPSNTDNDLYSKIISGDIENSEINYAKKRENPNDITLEPYDMIHIRPDPSFKKQALVTIEGFVYYPGEYALSSANDKVTDIINRAGGLRPDGYSSSSKLVRNGEELRVSFDEIIRNPRSRKNFKLMEGDIIVIGSKPNIIKILGEVNTPGNYQYIKGKSFKDYIKTAGGYTGDAEDQLL